MRKYIKLLFGSILILSMSLLLSCSLVTNLKTNPKSIEPGPVAGKWFLEGVGIVYELKADSTFDFYLEDQTRSTMRYQGTYEVYQEDKISELLGITDEEFEANLREYIGENDSIYKLVFDTKISATDENIEYTENDIDREYLFVLEKDNNTAKFIDLDDYSPEMLIRK